MAVWAVAGGGRRVHPEVCRNQSLLWKEEVTTPFSSWQRSLLSCPEPSLGLGSGPQGEAPVQGPCSPAGDISTSTPLSGVSPFVDHPSLGSGPQLSFCFGPMDAIAL